ncbi:MAG: hypothetical protein EPO24_04040 [Bacteroidetes bacterium]|nr:MAG: hypothetical protein EPO24_04040 [Bacteroidota bacterium]
METQLNAGGNVGAEASLEMQHAAHLKSLINHHYMVECYKPDGSLRWREEFDNLVVTEGRNKYLDATLKTGLTTPAWYVGLKGAGALAAGDTMASHAGWSEVTPYSNANRPAFTPGTIASGSVDNSASKAVYNINATSTVVGAFMSSDNTKGGTTGTLLGGGDFANSRSVYSGDTLNVTVTASLTSS